MKKVFYYLHGFLFATLSPLYVYVSYPDLHTHVSPDSIWKLVGIAYFLHLLSNRILCFITRSFSDWLITTCLYLGILYLCLPFLFIISAILIASLLLAIVKIGFDLLQPCLACIVISIVITTYVGTEYAQIHQVSDAYPARSLADSIEIKASAARNSYKPDIYYIILDAYAGEKMLKELHAFNNSMFTSALKKRGFILPPGSKSNYLRTIHSLSSSLNMQYLGAISETMGTSSLWWPLRETFADNETRKFLESQGYKTLVIASGWDFTTITDADTYKQPFPIFLSDFEDFY
jgi:hypothetical protein